MHIDSRVILLVVPALIVTGGCAAARGRAAPQRAVSAGSPTTAPSAPAIRSIALLPLDRILPPAVFPSTRPATLPTTQPDRPPLEALTLYAEACDDLLKGRRIIAAELLEKAAALDAGSFEVHYALAKVYRTGGGDNDRSLAELEKAAAIDPDRVELQADLGRLHLAKGDTESALWHLRLALKASDYASPSKEADAAVAELFAGRALARAGYHAAAVEVYERLLARMERPSFALRGDPETAFLLARPEMLRLQLAESCEKIGRPADALRAYDEALARNPDDLLVRARAVRALLALNRPDEATSRAADAVARAPEDPNALELLRQACRAAGRAGSVADELRRLHEKRPRDMAVLLALADMLRMDGKAREALELLRKAEGTAAPRADLVRRIYETSLEVDPAGGAAARYLVDWSARHPDAVYVVAEHWEDLVRPSREHGLSLRSLEALEPVDGGRTQPDAKWAAAKAYWVAQLARLRHRNDVARQWLGRAVEGDVAYAPAYRAALSVLGDDPADAPAPAPAGDATAKAAEDLAARAAARGDAALAAEVRGLGLLGRRDYAAARQRLDEAAKLGGKAPELHFARAVAARGAGDTDGYEQILWKLVGDWPDFDDACEALFGHYASRGSTVQAARVLSQWLAADRGDVTARLLQIREAFAVGRGELAGRAIEQLLAQHGDDARVLVAAKSYYRQAGKLNEFVQKLTERLAVHPGDVPVAAQAVDVLAEQGQVPEASRLLDAAHKALADDPDLLYEMAHLYDRVGQKGMTEQVLHEVLRLDSKHPGAANDLGYSMGDRGTQLDEAERLTRQAVAADPVNPSFLDSLGWVLYKRGRFDEARQELGRAVDASRAKGEDADPIVLDHLGDATYRAGDAAEAAERWKQALRQLTGQGGEGQGSGAEGDGGATAAAAPEADDASLRLRLERKAKQVDAAQPVSVAPIAGEP